MSRPHVTFFATAGGHGHAVRGLAVLRALAKRGIEGTLVAPERHRGWCESEGVALVAVDSIGGSRAPAPPGWPGEPERGSRGASALLVVDTFPVGPGGELRPILESTSTPAWLLARRRRQPFDADVVRFCVRRFERIFELEPGAAADLPTPATPLPAITIREAAECLPRAAARRALGAGVREWLVLLVATGGAPREAELIRLVRKALGRISERRLVPAEIADSAGHREAGAGGSVRLLAFAGELPACRLGPSGPLPGADVVNHFPAMELLRGADVLVTAGGFASLAESRALGLRPIAIPQRRRFDDQFERVGEAETASSPEELEAALLARLEGGIAAPPVPARGAELLAEEVASRLRRAS